MQTIVLRGWDLVLCLALEALVAVMLTFGVVREIYRETSPRESMGASHRPAPEDLAKEAEFRRLVDFETTSEDRIEARRAVERREHDVKAFAEQYIAERMVSLGYGCGASTGFIPGRTAGSSRGSSSSLPAVSATPTSGRSRSQR